MLNEFKKMNYDNWTKQDLIKEVKKLQKRKKYGLVWNEKKIKETFEKDTQGKLPILKEITKNSIGGGGEGLNQLTF